MTDAQKALHNLEVAIKTVQQAIDDDSGYGTTGECERLGHAWADLQKAIETNNWKEIPF